MVTAPDMGDEHPAALVTINVHDPALRPLMVVVGPLPLIVIPPGYFVMVQFPGEGSPLSRTLPVEIRQVGCTGIPGCGAAGVAGCVLITTLDEGFEVQPSALVTVKE